MNEVEPNLADQIIVKGLPKSKIGDIKITNVQISPLPIFAKDNENQTKRVNFDETFIDI